MRPKSSQIMLYIFVQSYKHIRQQTKTAHTSAKSMGGKQD